ncbi:DUF397 domain-containing protein [Thermomonospora cellulosilytica]|uniref:DUF397 domain-containing protein n=1 Tax=Thermomonospora cellulosilytica TaxID=1411118 RepID=A0A7W3MSQ9_9ACTN|nr:DUF397 domain-containing protein [Thermomonospora cellulosilytica]MBA9001221.1 hypothetical protein [Thermomonospora cellulosilytica]
MDVTRVEWRKSSHSSSNGGNCVELADLASVVGIRDSKSPEAGHLAVDRAALSRLVGEIKGGDLDL